MIPTTLGPQPPRRLLAVVMACAGFGWTTPTHAAEPPEPPPPSGKGLLGTGSFGVAFGTLCVAAGVTVLAIDPGGAGPTGAWPLGFGAAFVTLGALGIHYGRRRRARARAWEQESGLDLDRWRTTNLGEGPPPGRGMIIGGSLLVVSTAALLGGSAGALDLDRYFGHSPRRWTYFGIVAGSLGIVSGAVLLHG